MPLPPYIRRDGRCGRPRALPDGVRPPPGAVAAPTAGLHFDDALLAALRARRRDRDGHAARRRGHLPAGAHRGPRARTACTRSGSRVDAGRLCERSRRARARRAGRRGRHHRGAQPRGRRERRRSRRSRARPSCSSARLPLPRGRRAGDQLPPAGVHAADAGVRVRRPRARCSAPIATRSRERYRFFSYGDAMFLTPRRRRGERHEV
jgi:S-adenosylmethionine:tRNA ribosyltransferase-isomerase